MNKSWNLLGVHTAYPAAWLGPQLPEGYKPCTAY